jgi:hypothetical protein
MWFLVRPLALEPLASGPEFLNTFLHNEIAGGAHYLNALALDHDETGIYPFDFCDLNFISLTLLDEI